jgi:ATP-dependent Lon protease
VKGTVKNGVKKGVGEAGWGPISLIPCYHPRRTFPTMPDTRLPVLPLRDVVIYPYVVMPLMVGRQASLAAVEAATKGDGLVFLVAQRDAQTEDPAAADLFRVGVVGRVLQISRQPNGASRVLVEGVSRAQVTRYAPTSDYLRAALADEPVVPADEATISALARRAVVAFEEYVGLHRRIPPEVVSLVQGAASVDRQAYGIAAHLGVRLETRQMLLEAAPIAELLRSLSDVLSAELDLLRLERKIDDEVRGSLVQNQREFYLQEQLKAIHRELGEDDGADASELEAQVERRGLPDAVKARALREVRKLRRMSPLSPESTVTRNFVEWILGLPWTERTTDVVDLAHARAVLDEDHYGLEEVKDRILDFISVLSIVGKIEGPILCLVGPPGVGKTSLGRSIARALGRKFVRMSLGGVRDEAEIRGHRRTYVGAMPGRVIQAMRRAEVVNPVLLLDEIDKLGQDYRGDPSAALLEVLDPEQNKAFSDHYLEIDYDLSQVLFITTANYLPQVPEPLRDRMEIIRLSGYVDQEKHAIARQFLIPKQLRANGIDPSLVSWDPDVVPALTRRYTREAGVRELERRLARVARKLARRVAEAQAAAPTGEDRPAPPPPVLSVTTADLKALLGPAPHDAEALTLESRVGVVTGLAYTNVGGEVLEIEVSVVGGRGKLQLTGTLGDVMKESANAALSYIRSRAGLLGIERDFHKTRDIHVHIPAGATPKDGPSAGIAIATAIVSALANLPVRGDVAMTGEITLRGRVLEIGGLKEKAVAAHRDGVRHVIVPHANLRDVEELPEDVRGQLRFHGVKSMDEVLALALVRVDYVDEAAHAAAPLAH